MKRRMAIFLALSSAVTAMADIPYPKALDDAAIAESKISDIARQALPLGNGDLNGLLWERNGELCLRVGKNDVWDARIDTSKDGPVMKIDIARNKSTGMARPLSWNHPYPQPRCAAVVRLGKCNATSAKLDLRRAVAVIKSKDGRQTSVRSLADRNVFLIETDREVSLEDVRVKELPSAQLGETGGVQWLHMKMPGDVDYAGMEYAMAVAADGRQKAVSLVTSFDTKSNVLSEAIRSAKEAVAKGTAMLVARHEEAWSDYWSESGVAIDDPDFQLWWYRMAYMLRCIARPGAMPAGLYAFRDRDGASWHGDYHHNYNAWQPYWATFVLNHPDFADPWVSYMNDMLPRLRWFAKTTYDCEGACVGICSFAFEPDPAKCKSVNCRQITMAPYSYTMGMAGMSVQNLWYCHLYRPDRKYLEKKIYPVLREVALFYCSFTEKCPRDADGKAKLGPSFSPEHGRFGVANVPFDIAYARFTLKAAIAAAGELGCDRELASRFRKAFDLLPPYPTAPNAGGQQVVVDWVGCKFNEIKLHNITVPAVPVFPADQITWFSSESEKELFRNTLRLIKHRGSNSTVMFSVAKARFSMLDALEDARRYYRPNVQPNGMFYWPDHGFYLTESVGLAAMISEFLLQSVDNIIRVFPCWPTAKDAQFTDLRAQGGFLVSAKQKAGRVTELKIVSTVGGALRVVSPWAKIAVVRDGAVPSKLAPNAHGIVAIETKAGERLAFTPLE